MLEPSCALQIELPQQRLCRRMNDVAARVQVTNADDGEIIGDIFRLGPDVEVPAHI